MLLQSDDLEKKLDLILQNETEGTTSDVEMSATSVEFDIIRSNFEKQVCTFDQNDNCGNML